MAGMKTFRPYLPDQMLLLPASIQEWLPDGHLARFVGEVVGALDLSAIEETSDEERGSPPYHPRRMVKVLVSGYCTGTSSSRRLATAVYRSDSTDRPDRLHSYTSLTIIMPTKTNVRAMTRTGA